MSADEMTLHLDITGDASSGIAAADSFNKSIGVSDESIAGLEKMLGELTAQLGITTESLGRATVAHKVHSDTLQVEEGRLGLVARAMNAVGLEAGGMAARVEAASGALQGMGKMVPELLAIGAAIAAAFGAFKFIEGGVENAARMQSSLETLRAAVDAQGGSWDRASASIQKFLDIESTLSGFTQNELVSALNRLVVAGNDVTSAMALLRDAEEEAVARHSDLLTVVNLLIQAEGGRTRGLVAMDPSLKNLIDRHATLNELLDAMHKKNADQLKDGDSLERSNARQKAAIDALSTSIGTNLVPLLTWLTDALTGLIAIGVEFGQGFVESFRAFGSALSDLTKQLYEFAVGLNSLVHGDFSGAGKAFAAAFDFKAIGKDAEQMIDGIVKMIPATMAAISGALTLGIAPLIMGHAVGHNINNEDLYLHNQAMSHQHVKPPYDPRPKVVKTGSGSSHSASSGADYNFTDMADGARSAKAAIDPLDLILKSLPKTIAGYTTAIADLDQRLVFENSMNKELTGLLVDAKTKYEDLRASYNAYGESLGKHPTKAEKEHLHDLKVAVDDAKHSYDDLKASVDANAASLQKHTDEVKTDTAELTRLQEEQYKKITAAIGTLADQGVKLFNSLFTAGKNGAQSFGQVFKSMIDDIVSYLEKSAITSLLMSIFHIPTIGPDGKPQSSNAGGIWGAIQTVLGAGGMFVATTPPASANPNIANDPAFGFGGMNNPFIAAGGIGADGTLAFGNGQYSSPNIAGGSSGSGFGLGSSNPFSSLSMLSKNPNSFLGNLAQNGWGAKFGGPGGTATAGSYGLAAIGGALVGQLAFGGRGYADMGGSIGGMAGLYLGGPVGAVIGAILGSAAGSLFGNHFDPANEPDINKTQEWGQWLADLQGKTSGNPMNANGQQFVMDSQTQTATKSKGWNIVMEDFVAKFRGKEKDLPSSLQGVFSGIADLWGGAQGQADFNNNGKDGNLQLGAGKMANYTSFWQYITGYGQQIADLMSNYSPTQTYAASMQGAVSGIGTYTPDGNPMILHDFPDTGAPGGYSAPPSGGGGVPIPPSGGGIPYQPPGGHGYVPRGGPAPQTIIYQNVQGTIIAQNQLAQAANIAVGQAGRSGRAYAVMNR